MCIVFIELIIHVVAALARRKRGTMTAVAALLDAAARRRDRLTADLAAFMAEHGSQDISGLSREEVRELFSILLAQAGLNAEIKVLRV
jgi:hypothetical protein